MKLTILGCYSATPRALTNTTSQVLEINNNMFLIDCGEGTQVQLRKHKIKFNRIKHIFISHLHGDHFFGLAGLISTFRLLTREADLHIYGPKGIKEVITLQMKLADSWTNYRLIFHELVSENSELIYEDDDVLVVNKPAGMVVHPGHGNYTGTLVHALAYLAENLPVGSSGEQRPGLVHRLDKNTTGVMVVAASELAMSHLAKQFYDRTTQREYIAIVWGNVKEDEGTITGHIGRSLSDRLQMAVFEDGSEGKHAVTHYKVIERFSYVTLVQCKLETGRTHQIRAHFKHIGHTLFNDERYGGDAVLKGTTFTKYKQFVENCFKVLPRQALHAKTLGFEHPTTKEFLRFNSEIPQDIVDCLEKWRTYTVNQKEEH